MRSDTRLLSSADHDRISAAIATAELHSDGEIGAIVAERSSDYGDWAIKGWRQIFFHDPDGNVIEVHALTGE